MDLAALVPWLSAIALLISVGTSITTILTSGAKKTAAKVAEHERRLQALENDMRHLPNREQAHRMELAVAELAAAMKTLEAGFSGRMDALDERLKPVASTSARLQEYLLRQAEQKGNS